MHVGVRGADRAIAVCDRLRPILPELLAVSANSVFLDGRDSGLQSVRSQIFTKSFPRCGVPEAFGGWAAWADYVDLLVRTNSIVEHTQLWWSVRPHHSFGTVEVRICDSQSGADESTALAGLIVACVAQAAADYDEGVEFADPPGRLIEENFWRAIRYGLDGRMIDTERLEEFPAGAIGDRLMAWTAPARAQLKAGRGGSRGQRRAPATGRAGRWCNHAGGLRRRGGPRGPHVCGRGSRARASDPEVGEEISPVSAEGREPTEEEMRAALEEQMRNIRVEDVVLQTTATLINLAGRRVGLAAEPGQDASGDVDLQQAKLAIDGAMALAPLCPPEQAEPIKQALSQLQMAYSRLAGGPGGDAPPAPEADPGPRPRPRRTQSARRPGPSCGLQAVPGGRLRGERVFAARRSRRCRAGYGLRTALRGAADRRDRRDAGRVHAPPRRRPFAAAHGSTAAPTCGRCGRPGSRIFGPVRLRGAEAGARPGHVRGLRPVHRPPRGRVDTFYDGPSTTHVSAADPYCHDLRATLVAAARELDIAVVDGGTVVVIEGPRFSTRAESRWFAVRGVGGRQHDPVPRGLPRP